jgi:hypothetical protein
MNITKTWNAITFKRNILYSIPDLGCDDNLSQDMLHSLECVGVGLEDSGTAGVLVLPEGLHARTPVLYAATIIRSTIY